MSNSLDPDQDRHLLVLIWVSNVCKGYQQTTKVTTASKERVTVIVSDSSQFPRFSAFIYIIVLVLSPIMNYEIIISQSLYLKDLSHRHNILSFSDAGKSTIGGQIL